jgi:hypothetical protein
MARLAEFVKPNEGEGPIISHLLDLAPPGTFDEVWIPRIKDEGWTVISADGGRTPNKRRGKKLPRLCAENGITLILLSPAVHNRKAFDKTRTILSVWDQIVEIAVDPSLRGKRYMLEPLNPGNPGVGRLVERPLRSQPIVPRTSDDAGEAPPDPDESLDRSDGE